MNFAEYLKKALKEANCTQRDLADRIGVSQPIISYWLSGERTPGIARIRRIAQALSILTGAPLKNTQKEASCALVCSHLGDIYVD